MITKYPPDNKCPRCHGTLFDCVDMVDGSHYIGCHTTGCKRIEYEDEEPDLEKLIEEEDE